MHVGPAPSQMMNGTTTPSPAEDEDEELYTHLLRLRDLVVAGKHAQFKLPPSALEQLKATLKVQADTPIAGHPNEAANGDAYATNAQQPTLGGLPGLSTSKPASSGLDPIFLEKSDSLVRAEGQLKRQRIERDLQAQVEQRRHTSSRDQYAGPDALPRIDIDAVLLDAQARVLPMSGLKSRAKEDDDTSFDENDYYSSQVQSDWSPNASSSKGSDKATGAFTGDFERFPGPARPSFAAESSLSAHHRGMIGSTMPSSSKHFYAKEADDDVYEPDDEDDEYTPPDAVGYGASYEDAMATDLQRRTPPDDDNSDYEPGEITQESAVPTPHRGGPQAGQTSPRVPVIRNHLTHIAAPQPNRVSPLTTVKGPNIELELVNGRPEVVQKTQPRSIPMQSRASTASPSANGVGVNGKKRRNKKRKRDFEPNNRARKRRVRESGGQSPPSPAQPEPYIKHEPVSPPPFAANVPETPMYEERLRQQYGPPPQIDLASPQIVQPQVQYVQEPPRSALRYEYAPAEPSVARLASPTAYRPVQKDTQDLRRVASMHYAQRPVSPQRQAYSPVGPYRTASMTYGEQPATPHAAPEMPKYQEVQDPPQYVRSERAPPPQYTREHEETYAPRAQSPALMPPPPLRRIVVDQFGNRYHAAEPAPAPVSARESVAPERRQQPEQLYERAPSRMAVAYAHPQHGRPYEPTESRMAPQPSPAHSQYIAEQPLEYVDANGYRLREYSNRPPEPMRYAEPPTSPVYQEPPHQRYEQMLPPSTTVPREPTSPVHVPRAYSVRPEEPIQAPVNYLRQASAAHVQYAQHDMAPPPPPVRAMSVMPTGDYGGPMQQPRAYSYAPAPAPQAVKYVDQYGNEVHPREVRQVSEFRYQ